MTAIDTYYGKSQGWRTYLEIYSRKGNGPRQIHRQLTDQDAYDTWHLSFYLKEILAYKRLLSGKRIRFDDIPRKEKNLLVYLLLQAYGKPVRLLELGHSLFELIDGMELVGKYFSTAGKSAVSLKKQAYLGVDISADLRLASVLLHQDYNVRTFPAVDSVDGPFGLLYDRNVSSYAFTEPKELAAFINRSDAALMNLFVAKGKTFLSRRLGKGLTYFSLAGLVKHLKKPLFRLFGEKAPGPFRGHDLGLGQPVIEGFFLYADQPFAEKFMNLSLNIPEVKRYFREKSIRLQPAGELL